MMMMIIMSHIKKRKNRMPFVSACHLSKCTYFQDPHVRLDRFRNSILCPSQPTIHRLCLCQDYSLLYLMTIMRKHEGGGVDQVRLCLFKHWSLTNYGIHIHYYEPFTSSPLFNPMESMNGGHSLALPPWTKAEPTHLPPSPPFRLFSDAESADGFSPKRPRPLSKADLH